MEKSRLLNCLSARALLSVISGCCLLLIGATIACDPAYCIVVCSLLLAGGRYVYRIAGIDCMNAGVVIADSIDGEFQFERRWYVINPELRLLVGLADRSGVEEVVMESTAQYWS